MVFDTTSANTGLWSGRCVEVQRRLQKPLPWCVCRKHIEKLIVSSVFDELHIETSKSPEILIFKNFRTYFSHVSQTNLSYPPFVNEVNCSTTDDVEFLNELQKDATNLAVLEAPCNQAAWVRSRFEPQELIDVQS